jgi:DNA-binding transcriptional LysR family regulator
MIKHLYHLAVFAKVVEAGSFTSAASSLALGKSVISRHVSELERHLGVQLLIRTTRSIALTDEGAAFYASCRRMLEEAEAARASVSTGPLSVTGLLRISCSVNLGMNLLCEIVANFRAKHPKIAIELNLEDRFVNIVEERYDLAIRTGRVADSRLRALKVASPRVFVCASAKWKRQNKPISSPRELEGQPWIRTTLSSPRERLRLRNSSGKVVQIPVNPVLITNAGLAAKSLVSSHAGIGLLPDFAIRQELRSGTIVRLLPEWEEAQDHPLSILFPDQQFLPPRVRLMIDFIKAEMNRSFSVTK